jgi:hypothetical protein
MKTQSEQLLIHVAPPLKGTIEALAAADGRSVSGFCRRLLVDQITKLVTEGGGANVGAPR